jgi:t-SNARE complex subunit (syntaxin)
MTDYSRLKSCSVQELAASLKDFQTSIRKLKAIVSHGIDREAFARERDHTQKLSKDIIQTLRNKPGRSSDRVQFDKLAKEFEQLLPQFTELTQSFINKEKEIMKNSQTSPQVFELAQEHKRESFEFKYAGGLEDVCLNQREDELMALELDMKEINRMFTDVAMMVDEQGNELEEIDNEVDIAFRETGKATGEITRAEGYQRAARKKMFLIILILSVIVAVVIAVVVGLFR